MSLPCFIFEEKKNPNTKDTVLVLVIFFLPPRLHSKQTLQLEMREKVHIPSAGSVSPNTHLMETSGFLSDSRSQRGGRAQLQDRRASHSNSHPLNTDWWGFLLVPQLFVRSAHHRQLLRRSVTSGASTRQVQDQVGHLSAQCEGCN